MLRHRLLRSIRARTFTTTVGVKTSATGAFQRETTTFRNWIDTAPNARFPPESGRYHLYASFGCPWANRCLAMINLKGLQDSIGVTIVHPVFQRTRPHDANDSHIGWVFADPTQTPTVKGPTGLGTYSSEGAMPDLINNARTIRDLYDMCTKDKVRYSVPVLWDKKERTIVSNESGDIIRMLNNSYPSKIDYYPPSLRNEIESVNSWVYEQINNGVYKCGFATQQGAYDEAVTKLFEGLDRAEDILSKQRFLCGNRFTEADLKLFMTLIRFDDVHVGHFKTNKKLIREYANLSNYVRDIYQHPAIKPTINMKHIITHYYSSQVHVNPTGIIPQGPNIDFSASHDRAKFKALDWYI